MAACHAWAAWWDARVRGLASTWAMPRLGTDGSPRVEGGGLDPAVDRQVVRRRPQVLADRDDVDADGGEVGERLDDLVVGLPHADDQPRLRRHAGGLRPGQQGEAAGVAGRRAHGPLQPRHRLEVVVEDIRPGVDDRLQRVGIALEVGDEDLDAGARPASADRPDRGGEGGGAAVGKVVAGDGGHDGEGESHPVDGLGDPLGFAGVEGDGPPGVDEAEAAGAGAALAVDHEGRGAVGPALEDVRAARLLAHGDEVEVADRLLQPQVVVADPDARHGPLGLAGLDRQTRTRPRRRRAGASGARGCRRRHRG